eukprot:TRINITY_DN11543_c0_g1_i1.p1 TRINITY_DN11543_c0_g1~~TRINITY_DN11543_c0_g1_i1.p1  ORF type:complete len:322 (+),score=54.13 TRINITY_DN11543_c0_g1_i1:27-992(+)
MLFFFIFIPKMVTQHIDQHNYDSTKPGSARHKYFKGKRSGHTIRFCQRCIDSTHFKGSLLFYENDNQRSFEPTKPELSLGKKKRWELFELSPSAQTLPKTKNPKSKIKKKTREKLSIKGYVDFFSPVWNWSTKLVEQLPSRPHFVYRPITPFTTVPKDEMNNFLQGTIRSNDISQKEYDRNDLNFEKEIFFFVCSDFHTQEEELFYAQKKFFGGHIITYYGEEDFYAKPYIKGLREASPSIANVAFAIKPNPKKNGRWGCCNKRANVVTDRYIYPQPYKLHDFRGRFEALRKRDRKRAQDKQTQKRKKMSRKSFTIFDLIV